MLAANRCVDSQDEASSQCSITMTAKPESRSQSGLNERLSCTVFKKCLLLNSLDPFYVYKMPSKKYDHSNYRLFSHPTLRMTPNRCCRRSETLGRLVCAWCGYYLMKSSLIAVLHCLVYRTERVEAVSGDSMLWNALSTLASAIGGPSSGLGSLALYNYITASWPVYNGLVVLPFLRHDSVMDMPYARFLLEPEHELQRVYLTIRHKLDSYLTSITQMKSNLFQGRFQKVDLDTKGAGIISKLASLDRSRQQILQLKSQIDRLLPPVYSPEWHRQLQVDLSVLAVPLLLLMQLWLSVFYYILIAQSYSSRCKTMNLRSQCSVSRAFSVQEQLYILETIVCLTLGASNFAIFTMLYALIARSQLKHVGSMRNDLDRCLKILRSGREELNDETADQLLLETFVRTLVPLEDIKKGTRSATEMLTAYSFTCACVLGPTMTDALFAARVPALTRHVLIVVIWSLANVYAFLCAHIAAQADHLEKLHWSVVSELVRRGSKTGFTISSNFNFAIWRKMVYSACSIRELYITAPLRVQITYQKVIELNFFIVWLAIYVFVR